MAVWLHGYRGYTSEGYGPSSASMQKHANTAGAIIVGFPAPIELGDGTQQWSEDPAVDHAHVQAQLHKLSARLPIDMDRIVLFGFSQGAVVAADVATIYPERYLGAILMSPGALGEPRPATTAQPEHKSQVYYSLCGADEHPGNVALAKFYDRHLRSVLGAKVKLTLYPGMSRHTRPPDIETEFPKWLTEVLQGRSAALIPAARNP